MKKISTEIKVGTFAIIVIIILAFMTFKVGGIGWMKKEGYVVNIYFKNIAGLDEKTKVKIAGVDSGIIEKIELVEGVARVKVRIKKDIKLYSDASASIKATGLLGDKYLEIKIGTQGSLLKEGDTIKNVMEIVDIDDMVRNLSEVSENISILASSLNEAFGTVEARRSLKIAILNLKQITENLNETIAVNDKKLRLALDNINNLTIALNNLIDKNKEPLTATISNIHDFSDKLKKQGPDLLANLNKATNDLKVILDENRPSVKNTFDTLNDISTRISKGEGSLGKLIKDESLYNSITKAAERIDKTVSAVERFKTYISFQTEYLTKPSDAKGYFYVTLQPKTDKYYILGIVGDPVGSVTIKERSKTIEGVTTNLKEETIKKEIQFTAQFAKRYKDVALRIGLTENTFGVGGDYFFNSDKGKITADIWDFSNDEEGAKNPHVKIGVDYFLFKNLFISAGADNILNKKWRGGYAGIGLRFEDEDLKYLFGTLPSISTR